MNGILHVKGKQGQIDRNYVFDVDNITKVDHGQGHRDHFRPEEGHPMMYFHMTVDAPDKLYGHTELFDVVSNTKAPWEKVNGVLFTPSDKQAYKVRVASFQNTDYKIQGVTIMRPRNRVAVRVDVWHWFEDHEAFEVQLELSSIIEKARLELASRS